eukprot:TRINITY_DN74781_c0_g1_i1.p1 TRINITY_DN74781_c0_g1~~TRINITY_DN74781_c0_g1_i1.p1  ORF type:complete len:1170 (-),score=218.67 TRINITY_DN74781_c0_g1_i1:158-3667(-)
MSHGGYTGLQSEPEKPVVESHCSGRSDVDLRSNDSLTIPNTEPLQLAIEKSTAISRNRISLGLCIMGKKVKGAPMQAILRRLELSDDFHIIIFPEDVIMNAPIEQWPKVRCLIAFASSGFPLDKCIEYCKLVNPILINDLESQRILSDRVAVYRTLQKWSIPCPEFIVIDHLADDKHELIESEDDIIYNGQRLRKPFVEKPRDGDRHDIYIYYPRNAGGGAKKLFRKEKDKSSEFDVECTNIRRDGLYLYEKFLPTQGTDIKVYTVGAEYVHAEARKAPTIDGKVERSKDGKEVRYPVVLAQVEKAISALIVQAFRQAVCGFDILRTKNRSIVCDVNGWSFVKGNQKYYNDCGVLIRKHFLEKLGLGDGPESGPRAQFIPRMILRPCEEVLRETQKEWQQDTMEKERLRCVIVVMRHGDRRPKEKMKFKSKLPALLNYFTHARNQGDANKDKGDLELKFRTPEEMRALNTRMQETASDLRNEIKLRADMTDNEGGVAGVDKSDSVDPSDKVSELKSELQNIELLIEVLEMKDRFSGLERKVQLKVAKWKSPKESSNEEKDRVEGTRVAQVLVVAKWGGELTIAGLQQAEALGRTLRVSLYGNDPTGLLRLHSSFRHDFKIYSSQEGRCQITAAAFTKGFLDLEGDITPILVSLVTCDQFARSLLDEPIPQEKRDAVKKKIDAFIASNKDLGSQGIIDAACPTRELQEAVRRIGKPSDLLHRIKDLVFRYIDSMAESIAQLTKEMRQHGTDVKDNEVAGTISADMVNGVGPLSKRTGMVPRGPGPQIPFDIKDELLRRWLHLRRKHRRWQKMIHGLAKPRDPSAGFTDENVMYDASKIPDLWDNVYYDLITHRHMVGDASCAIAEQLGDLLQPLNNWVSWSEYGISKHEKRCIGADVIWRLAGKILVDLEFMLDRDACDAFTDEAGKYESSDPGIGYEDGDDDVSVRQTSGIGLDVDYPASYCSAIESPSKDTFETKKSKRNEPLIHDDLKRGLRDPEDWHPRLSEQVARVTGITATERVKSRIYSTSASTLHALFNLLWHGHEKKSVASGINHVADINFLSHMVFRCYELDEDDPRVTSSSIDARLSTSQSEKGRYRVEVSMSPGVQVTQRGESSSRISAVNLRLENCEVAPLQVVMEASSLDNFEQFLTEILKEYRDKDVEVNQEDAL